MTSAMNKAPCQRLGLVAHDDLKPAMLDWVKKHARKLAKFKLFCTGTTGGKIAEAFPKLDVTRLKSGPLGGDQQLGAAIAQGELDALIFLVDPMSPHPRDVAVKALNRLCLVYNIPCANNTATADLVIKGL